jgi:hypothetical protein
VDAEGGGQQGQYTPTRRESEGESEESEQSEQEHRAADGLPTAYAEPAADEPEAPSQIDVTA